MQITALNSTEELKSFPINQSIRLKFEKAVEDSLLESRLSLIRLPNQTGLFNISETYNQSIGYIREKFDIEETTITSGLVNGSFIVVVKPVKPLSPGFEYVLFIDKTISPDHYGNSGKHRSYCKTTILKILDYQISHALNNTQLAQHFDVSRNTIAKWRRLFI